MSNKPSPNTHYFLSRNISFNGTYVTICNSTATKSSDFIFSCTRIRTPIFSVEGKEQGRGCPTMGYIYSVPFLIPGGLERRRWWRDGKQSQSYHRRRSRAKTAGGQRCIYISHLHIFPGDAECECSRSPTIVSSSGMGT